MNKLVVVLIAAIVIAGGVGVYFATSHNNSNGTDSSGEKVTDAVGREVTIPDNLDKGIVTVGSIGPLRLLSLFPAASKLVECDDGDVKDAINGRAYSYAWDYANKAGLKTHADNALSDKVTEDIGTLAPSLVIVGQNVYTSNPDNVDLLGKRCSVIVIHEQIMTTMTDANNKLDANLKFNIELIGKMVGDSARATEVINGIETILADIQSNKGTSDQYVYVAGMTYKGTNNLQTTFPTYMPLKMIGGNNAYLLSSSADKVTLNPEDFGDSSKVHVDLIMIDPSAAKMMSASQDFLEYFATHAKDMYVGIPIIFDSINYDCVLACCYYLEHLLYGKFTDEELNANINNVFKTFYGDERGATVFSKMTAFFEANSESYGVEMPLLQQVKITGTTGNYIIEAA